MPFLKLSFSYAFSLIELLISIVVIGIIFFTISFPIYINYKEKAYSASLINEVRACFYEIMDYCETNANAVINLTHFSACQNHTSLYGNVTFQVEGKKQCQDSILPEGFKVKAYFSDRINNYYAVCVFQNLGVKCSIEPK